MTKEKKPAHRRPVLTIFLCNLFLTFTVVFFSPMEVLLANTREFYFPFGNVWWGQLLLTICACLVLSGLMCLLPRRAGIVAAGVSLALGTASYVQVLFLNGSMQTLNFERIEFSSAKITSNLIVWILILLAVLLAVILLFRKKTKMTETAMRALSLAMTVMQTVGFVSVLITADFSVKTQEHALTTEGEFAMADGRNVIVLVLDTADGVFAREMMERFPEMYDVLSGWTWYPNATSRYSRTFPAIPYMLTGQDNHYDQPVAEYLDQAYSGSNFLKNMSESGVDCRVLGWAPDMVSVKADPYLANSTGYQYSHFDNLNLRKLEENLMKIALYKCLPYRFKNDFNYDMSQINTDSFLAHDDPYMYFSYVDSDFQYDLDGGVTVTNSYQKAFRFYHLFGVHPGVTWDEYLEERGEDDDTVDYPASLRGCFRNVEEFIRQLKELGLYDQATIIVTADHGTSGNTEPGHPLVRETTAAPIIMVKYAGSDLTQPLQENKAPVCHDDLFATVEQGLGIPVSGTGSGKALTDFSEGEARERYYYHTALYSHDEGEIVQREYLIDGDAEDLANYHLTGRWWKIIYSTNSISDIPFDPEEQ